MLVCASYSSACVIFFNPPIRTPPYKDISRRFSIATNGPSAPKGAYGGVVHGGVVGSFAGRATCMEGAVSEGIEPGE